LVLGFGNELMRAQRESVLLRARDAEAVREVLGGLPHEQADHRVGQALHDADDRREE
jgi:hypothetical protein